MGICLFVLIFFLVISKEITSKKNPTPPRGAGPAPSAAALNCFNKLKQLKGIFFWDMKISQKKKRKKKTSNTKKNITINSKFITSYPVLSIFTPIFAIINITILIK